MEKDKVQKLLHDLRNPVAAIHTTVEVALFEPALSPEMKQIFLSIKKEVERLAAMLKEPL